jgi:hypothetical protein
LDVSFDDIDIHNAITPVDIVVAGSAGLGADHSASFNYCKYKMAEEEKKASVMKEVAAPKRPEMATKR